MGKIKYGKTSLTEEDFENPMVSEEVHRLAIRRRERILGQYIMRHEMDLEAWRSEEQRARQRILALRAALRKAIDAVEVVQTDLAMGRDVATLNCTAVKNILAVALKADDDAS